VVEKVERNRIETIHIYQMSEEELKERAEQAKTEIEE
jgi:FtsZ-binding cell division protein ZapB